MKTAEKLVNRLLESPVHRIVIRFYQPNEQSSWARAVSAEMDGMALPVGGLPPKFIKRAISRQDLRVSGLDIDGVTEKYEVSLRPHIGWSVTTGRPVEGIKGKHGRIEWTAG